ncbi:GAF domain-containing protein [Halomonas sp. MCCC 1A17488]|uniref:GAF domain-containing protein n=1 Tax=unclassified Halomonas TaxID=2609666 RepID=UPI0018D268E9|nr:MULTISPECIES: GAF domain-containing protein [unclassified Halomonas]MCE8015371.1 GAF domain-containing protein [Halomonas sp. MCCC 1A17488]MCG3238704.1 GAF domain-containing protein [Halomonas sp. MCCC 1A17488]QPP51325.1 GAF domain-containing protein [Halomonas sp. SS10-MC5]
MPSAALDYALLARQLDALLDDDDWLANAAQTCAFIMQQVPELNWAGFYLQRQPERLTLGPFQGKPACNPIPFAKGVCGAAARSRQTQRIDDVHAIADHIACDAVSNSELVIPLLREGTLWGVLDLDSPRHARFSAEDQAGLERLVAVFIERTRLPDLLAAPTPLG